MCNAAVKRGVERIFSGGAFRYMPGYSKSRTRIDE